MPALAPTPQFRANFFVDWLLGFYKALKIIRVVQIDLRHSSDPTIEKTG
jgi:hypothetical protein